MKFQWLILLLGSCLTAFTVPAYAGPGGTASAPRALKNFPAFLKPPLSSYSEPKIDPAHQIWLDSRRVDVLDQGKMAFQIKEGIQISRDQFFGRYGQNLGLKKDDQMVERTVSDFPMAGLTVSRLGQKYKGLEVVDSEFVLQEEEGMVLSAIGQIAAGLDLDITPQVSEENASTLALDAVAAQPYEWETPSKGDLVIVSKESQFTKESFKLVYRFTLASSEPFGSWTVDIDAKTGAVVNRFDNLRYGNAPAKGVTYYNGLQEFVGEQEEQFRLAGNTVMDGAKVMIDAFDDRKPHQQGTAADDGEYIDFLDSNKDGYFDDPEDKVGVSAYWGVWKALEFYKNQFGWIGFDGKGKPSYSYIDYQLIDIRIVSKVKNGACYSPDKKDLVFKGSGEEGDLGPAVSLDIVGHEYTHAIVDHTSRLVYEGESASLNEGFSTIFGVLLESFVEGKKVNWLLGEDQYSNNYRHSLDYPNDRQYPDTYKGLYYQDKVNICNEENDYCGSHKNSTIPAHWFYLLVTGGTGANDNGDSFFVTGIGQEKAARIAFLTMISLPPQATFKEARLISIAAAESLAKTFPSLFGLNDVIAVTNAWQAVGVGSAYQEPRSLSPSFGTLNVEPWVSPVAFSWSTFPGEYEWKIEISKDKNFSGSDVIRETPKMMTTGGLGKSPKATFSTALDANTAYYWRVLGKKADAPKDSVRKSVSAPYGVEPTNKMMALAFDETAKEEDNWSPVQFFMTAPKKGPLLSPLNGSNDTNPWAAEFKYGKIPGAVSYAVIAQELPDVDPASIIDASPYSSPSSPEDHQTRKLKKSMKYSASLFPWGPKNAKGEPTINSGVSHESILFTTAVPNTVLNFPPNKASLHPWGIKLVWTEVKGAEKYMVVISKNQNLSNPVFKSGEISGFETVISLPPYPGFYYWGVYPKDEDTNEWGTTQIRSFTVNYQLTKPTPLFPTASPPYAAYKDNYNFWWTPVSGADQYKISVYDNVNGKPGASLGAYPPTTGFLSTFNNAPAYYRSSESKYGTKSGYCYQVQAVGPKGPDGKILEGLPSDPMCYVIGPPLAEFLSPAPGAVNVDYPTTLSWKCDACNEYKIDTYVVKWDSPPFGGSFSTTKTTGTLTTKPGAKYQCSVCTKKGVLENCWGGSTFTTKAAPKQEPKQEPAPQSCYDLGETVVTNLPACSSAQFSYNLNCNVSAGASGVAFTWNPVSGAKGYQVEITAPGWGSSSMVSKTTAQGNQSSPIPLNYWTGYIVNVRAINACDQVGAIQGKGKGFYLVP